MTRRSPAIVLLVLLIGLAVLFALASWRESRGPAARGTAGRSEPSGLPAPAFRATALDGHTINFPADYHGKLVLLDFWATWCGPCIAELPTLREAHKKYNARGFEILGVSLDGPRMSGDLLNKFAQQYQMNWPQIHAGAERLAALYDVSAIPAPFLVDGTTGRIIAEQDLRGPALHRAIERNLPAPQS